MTNQVNDQVNDERVCVIVIVTLYYIFYAPSTILCCVVFTQFLLFTNYVEFGGGNLRESTIVSVLHLVCYFELPVHCVMTITITDSL